MKLKFLTDGALMFGKNLVIGDLHLGIEYEFARKGVTIPTQTKKIQEKIDKLIKQNKIKHLIFIGDVRHNIPVPSKQEERELPGFLKHFSKKVKVSIIKGNHDGLIEKICPKEIDIYNSEGFAIDRISLSHGHAWPKEDAETMIVGHIHPVVEIMTEGARMIESVWIRAPANKTEDYPKLKEVIVMPAFNHLKTGAAINTDQFNLWGPLKKLANIPESDIFLLDGTYLGKLKGLFSSSQDPSGANNKNKN